ncbi:MAG: hypothetical protein GX974_04080 [Clostridiales bacterium]|nr:hypothetical protein [Clostridiales bacterium]
MIKCGVSEIIITPDLGMGMPGYLNARRSTGVLDDLYAKAIVFKSDSILMAILALDILDLETDDISKIRERVHEKTYIPKENIMICSTHTHTGPPVVNSFKTKRDESYISLLVDRAGIVASQAYGGLQPVKLGYAIGYEENIAFNRRYIMKDGSVVTNPGVLNPLIDRPAGPIDPEIGVIKICDLNDRPIAIVSSFACHLDVVGGERNSADYPGELSKILKESLGSQVVSIFLTGASGDINHTDVNSTATRKQGHYRKMGQILARRILDIIPNIIMHKDLDIATNSIIFTASKREIRDEEIELAQRVLDSDSESDTEKIFANEILKFRNIKERTFDVEIQVMRVGEMCITALPGDVFVQFGLDIKKGSPYKYNIISSHSNGRNGYIATREAFKQGGYETRTSRTNKLDVDVGYKMVNYALTILNEGRLH